MAIEYIIYNNNNIIHKKPNKKKPIKFNSKEAKNTKNKKITKK